MDIQGLRRDNKILALVNPAENFKKNAGLKVNESVACLIRKLAETHSQGAIAEILNERGLLRNGKDLWKQYHVSRYFKTHHIPTVCSWKGTRNVADEC
jgi:hypothetical protein